MSVYHTSIGAGRPLILIHGFCETSQLWSELSKKLVARFNIILPDLPGFGKSILPSRSFSIDDVAAQMLEWMKPWRKDRPVVVGHSLGGYVSLSMARQDPEAFSGIGLFHSTAFADTPEKKENRNKVIGFVERHGVETYTDSFVAGLFFQKTNAAIPETKKMAAGTSQDTLIAYAAAMRDRPAYVSVLETFPNPILFVAGEHDSLIPENMLAEQSELARQPFFRSIKASGHMGMFENELEATKILFDFMDFVPSSANQK